MILKVDPRYYDHARKALFFAEKVNDVEILRDVQPKIPAKPRAASRENQVLVPGRGRANRILNDAFSTLEKVTNPLIFILFSIRLIELIFK